MEMNVGELIILHIIRESYLTILQKMRNVRVCKELLENSYTTLEIRQHLIYVL